MGFTGLDGGIMVALAAGLWLVYLMPTWFKRREYAALEKTNVRRQQAIRILQETEPIPVRERVSAIVSPTGQIENPDKLNEAIQRSKAAQAARVASRQIAEEAAAPGQDAASRARVARRLRRTRAVVLLLLMAALITVVVQATLMITTGIGAGAWAVLGFAAVAAIVSFSALGRLATIARRRQAPAAAPVARPMRQRVVEEREAARPPVATWTPVSVPKPLYLSRSEAPAAAAASVDHMERLRAAALESDRALREAQGAPEVAPITKPETPLGAPSKYAAMGVVGKADVTGTDLDEVLRRRRAG